MSLQTLEASRLLTSINLGAISQPIQKRANHKTRAGPVHPGPSSIGAGFPPSPPTPEVCTKAQAGAPEVSRPIEQGWEPPLARQPVVLKNGWD